MNSLMLLRSMATWSRATRPNYTELPAAAISVSMARRHVSRTLLGWGREDLTEDAQCVTSELVTNGIEATLKDTSPCEGARHGEIGDHDLFTGLYVWVGLHQEGEGVIVEVWDRTRNPPKMGNPGDWAAPWARVAGGRHHRSAVGLSMAEDGRKDRVGSARGSS